LLSKQIKPKRLPGERLQGGGFLARAAAGGSSKYEELQSGKFGGLMLRQDFDDRKVKRLVGRGTLELLGRLGRTAV
jgi:hypothetical protein